MLANANCQIGGNIKLYEPLIMPSIPIRNGILIIQSMINRQGIDVFFSSSGNSLACLIWAEKPVLWIISIISVSLACVESNTTCASSAAKFTPACCTNGFLFKTFSMRLAQDWQVIPPI